MKQILRRGSLCTAITLLVSMPVLAQPELTTPEQKAGYAIGASIGSNLAGEGLMADLDMTALIAGLQDGAGGELKMSPTDMEAAIAAFSAVQQEKANAAMAREAEASRAFLASNATKPGVTTTASGLQYMLLIEAPDANAAMPGETDWVTVHYTGKLTDGTVFDSSVERNVPAQLQLNGVIPGWTEGLQLMKVGSMYQFVIPSELAYGAAGAPPVIPPNATLVFDVELISIDAPPAP